MEFDDIVIQNWLTQMKNCQIVQTKWSPLRKSWKVNNVPIVETIMNHTNVYLLEKYQITIRDSTLTPIELLQQTEIDVLGMEIKSNQEATLYAVNVINEQEQLTEESVLTKGAQAALALLTYLHMSRGQIIFSFPKTDAAKVAVLQQSLEDLQTFLGQYSFEFEFLFVEYDQFHPLSAPLTPIKKRTLGNNPIGLPYEKPKE